MFNFLDMRDNYDSRKVDNTVLDGSTTIDTCYVNDGSKPYETGISSPKYNHGMWVIVENYNTKEDAQKGHNKWVGIMSCDKLPEKLVDCNNSMVQQFSALFGDDLEHNEEF
jgi:hypothetical protein